MTHDVISIDRWPNGLPRRLFTLIPICLSIPKGRELSVHSHLYSHLWKHIIEWYNQPALGLAAQMGRRWQGKEYTSGFPGNSFTDYTINVVQYNSRILYTCWPFKVIHFEHCPKVWTGIKTGPGKCVIRYKATFFSENGAFSLIYLSRRGSLFLFPERCSKSYLRFWSYSWDFLLSLEPHQEGVEGGMYRQIRYLENILTTKLSDTGEKGIMEVKRWTGLWTIPPRY